MSPALTPCASDPCASLFERAHRILGQPLLALPQTFRLVVTADIEGDAVQLQQVEGVKPQRLFAGLERALQAAEIGAAVFVDDNGLAVDQCAACRQLCNRLAKTAKLIRPIEA